MNNGDEHMIKCSKCSSIPNENDMIGWKCNSCGKAFRVTKTQLHSLLMKKETSPGEIFLNCPSCKNSLDDGNENIAWQCSCGNISRGKLKDFEEKEEIVLRNNLIQRPEWEKETSSEVKECVHGGKAFVDEKSSIKICFNCGEKLPSDSLFCVRCGTRVEGNVWSNETPIKAPNFFAKNRRKIGIGAVAIVAVLLVLLIVNAVQVANLKKELLRDWQTVEGEDGAYILCILDFSEDEIEYKLETGYAWMNMTVYTYEYKVIGGNKMKVKMYDGNWETVTVKFNEDKTMMEVSPALTSADDEEQWFNFD